MKTTYILPLISFVLISCGQVPQQPPMAHPHLDDGEIHSDMEQAVQPPQKTNSENPYAEAALNRSYVAEINQQISWNNPQTGENGTFTPTREGMNDKGEFCREIASVTNTGAAIKEQFIIACQTINGVWHKMQ